MADEQKIGIYKYEPLWKEWHIDELIGKGSYGEVYRIYKVENGQRIEAAAKYISIPKADERKNYRRYTQNELVTLFAERANKFSIEISSMLKLKDSRNVVHYEDHIKEAKNDEVGWDIIIRMELLTSLEDYLYTSPFTKKDVVKLGIDICSAIASCQKNDIIHRDIKIENFFVDALGNYKLGDFGVSKLGSGTATGTITGTEDYMAPEISQEHKYNNTVDIYSLGIAMYQLLNNRRKPFIDADCVPSQEDEAQAHLKRIKGEEIPPPKYDNGELSRIILKACAFDRHQRYSSPTEMQDELKALLSDLHDEEVLKPREEFIPDFSGKTESDIPGEEGGKTLSDIPDGKSKSGTISEIDIGKKKIKKSKKPIWAVAIAAVICSIAIMLFALMPRTVPVSDILGLPEETVQMVVGDTFELKLQISPENATGTLIYGIDDAIAEIDENGIITAIASGETVVRVKGGDIVKEMKLNISDKKIPVEDITGIGESSELIVGTSMTLYCKVFPDNATEQAVMYASSDNNIATIGMDGVITAVSPGQTTITASADGVVKNMVLTVKEKLVETPTATRKPQTTQTPQTQTQKTQTQKSQTTQTQPQTQAPSTNTQPNYNSPAEEKPAVNNPPVNDKSGSSSSQSGNSNSGKQYEAGDLSAFPAIQ